MSARKKSFGKEENYIRLNNILSADKLPMDGECQSVALKDVERVLNEYFEAEDLTMEISESGRYFAVEIKFTATGIKTFNLLK